MDAKKIRITVLLGIAIVVLFVIAAERTFPAQFHKNNIIASAEELSLRITEELMDGDESFMTYVNGMTEEELVAINQSLDGFFGHVDAYTILRKVNADVYLVKFDLEVSNNYYVYQKIVNGKEIVNNMDAEILATKVEMVMAECPGGSDYEKVKFYHDYIVTHTEYGFLEGEDEILSYTAEGVLLRGTAVCNGYAEAMELLLLCSNIETYMAVGYTDEGSHAWNIVKLEDDWYHVDTTWDDPVPDMGEEALHVYLNISDEIMEKTHTWNRSAYPECTSLEHNYYEQEGAAFDSFNDFKSYVLAEMQTTNQIEVMVTDSENIQYDCGFVIKEGGASSVSWQNYEDGEYLVMLITVEK